MKRLILFLLVACSGAEEDRSGPCLADALTSNGRVMVEGSDQCIESLPRGNFSAEELEWIAALTPAKVRLHKDFEDRGYLSLRWKDVKEVGLVDVARCEDARDKECVNPRLASDPVTLGDQTVVWYVVRTPQNPRYSVWTKTIWYHESQAEPIETVASEIQPSTEFRVMARYTPRMTGKWQVIVSHGETVLHALSFTVVEE